VELPVSLEGRIVKIRWKDEIRDARPPEPSDAPVRAGIRWRLADGRLSIWWRGRSWEFTEEKSAALSASRRTDAGASLLSPMPGRVRQVLVAEGDRVTRGQALLVLEAMKMEHAIRSPHDGRVVRLAYGEGDLVDAGAQLAEVAAD
jgi:3-methylcrotonyl-CoA carboxylase alpha subunit